MPHERLKPGYTFDKDRLEELKKIVPEAFADGQINWDTLKEALGEYLEDDSPDAEHFGLFWPGKKQARRMAATPSKGTLVPVYGEGLKADGTPDDDGHNDSRNIFIEGENLEVLKILQKSYAGRIKMIYIDPPYNTGNDFVYEDDFKEPLQEYLRRTGQVDEEGRPLTTNTRADGRFHSKWLSMMYPRLRLARNLLRDDGVIFVSIDDNEVHHLRMMMNEIFGEENFRAEIVWQHSIQPKGYTGKFSIHHNYNLCYTKDAEQLIGNLERTDDHNKNYSNPDNDPNGLWRSGDVRNALYRKNLIYDLPTPSGRIIKPPKNGWRWSWETMQEKIKTGEIIFNKDETWIIRKIYLNKLEGRTPESIWFGKEVGTTREGINELKELFNDSPPFDTPKPTEIISRMLELSTKSNEEDIILDFFSGSASTAHAVLQKNNKDFGNRRFILIQLQEKIDISTPAGQNAKDLGFQTINQVAKERIKRVINKKKLVEGFKVLKLNESCFKSWQNYQGTDHSQLEMQFEEYTSPLVENWKPENLLTEIILMEGFPLDSSIEEVKEIKTNKIKQVSSGFHEHRLLVCLDSKIAYATIQSLKLSGDDVFICLDNAITDQDKVQLADKGMIKTI